MPQLKVLHFATRAHLASSVMMRLVQSHLWNAQRVTIALLKQVIPISVQTVHTLNLTRRASSLRISVLIAHLVTTAMTVLLTVPRSAMQGTTASPLPSNPIKKDLSVNLDSIVLSVPSFPSLAPTENTPWNVLSQKTIVLTVVQDSTAFVTSHPQL